MFSGEYALLALLRCSGGRGEAEGDSGVNRVRKWTNNRSGALFPAKATGAVTTAHDHDQHHRLKILCTGQKQKMPGRSVDVIIRVPCVLYDK